MDWLVDWLIIPLFIHLLKFICLVIHSFVYLFFHFNYYFLYNRLACMETNIDISYSNYFINLHFLVSYENKLYNF